MNLFKNDRTQPDQNEFISGYYLGLAQQIVQIRQELNISQTELAAKLCISARTLESWERGVRHPSSSAQALIKLLIKSPQCVLENLA